MSVPAASLRGVDLDRIRSQSEAAADELDRLGRALAAGTETDEEFGRICELLLKFDERQKAVDLLIPNIDVGDENHLRFREELAVPQAEFQNAIRAFECQFDVTLESIRSIRYLSEEFRCTVGAAANVESGISTFHDCLVEITCEASDQIVAHVSHPVDKWSFPLCFESGEWNMETCGTQS